MRHPGHNTAYLRHFITGIACQRCGARPGRQCETHTGRPRVPHNQRLHSTEIIPGMAGMECCFCGGGDTVNLLMFCRGKNLHVACEGCWMVFRRDDNHGKTRICPLAPELGSDADAALLTLRRGVA